MVFLFCIVTSYLYFYLRYLLLFTPGSVGCYFCCNNKKQIIIIIIMIIIMIIIILIIIIIIIIIIITIKSHFPDL